MAAPWKFNAARFLYSVAKAEQLPPPTPYEAVFLGASNVGKSSLINALFGIKNLARSSKTPGRTQLLNFFSAGEDAVLVDAPGYGFAHVPPDVRAQWESLMQGYLTARAERARAYVLVDCRRGLRDADLRMTALLQEYGIGYCVVWTKTDKLNKTESIAFTAQCDGLGGIATSIKDNSSILELRTELIRWGGAE